MTHNFFPLTRTPNWEDNPIQFDIHCIEEKDMFFFIHCIFAPRNTCYFQIIQNCIPNTFSFSTLENAKKKTKQKYDKTCHLNNEIVGK